MRTLASGNGNPGMAIKIIFLIFPAMIDQKVFLFGNQG